MKFCAGVGRLADTNQSNKNNKKRKIVDNKICHKERLNNGIENDKLFGKSALAKIVREVCAKKIAFEQRSKLWEQSTHILD